MKKLFLFLITVFLCTQIFGQPIPEGPVMVNLTEAQDDDRVNGQCYGLTVELLSFSAALPIDNYKIFLDGIPEEFPYTSSKDGKVFIVTDEQEISISIESKKGAFIGGTVTGIALEKGKMKLLQVYLTQERPMPVFDDGPVVKKPVIYLYPEKETEMEIALDIRGEMTFSYPKYKDGWKIKATPEGSITLDGRNYPYLFWEADLYKNYTVTDFKKGFVVSGKDIVSFLEDKLAILGLNQREITDFITFWAPQMQKNENNFIHFICNENYTEIIAALKMSERPDTEIRINMFYASVPDGFTIPEQKLISVQRKGFTLVEWGGAEIDLIP